MAEVDSESGTSRVSTATARFFSKTKRFLTLVALTAVLVLQITSQVVPWSVREPEELDTGKFN